MVYRCFAVLKSGVVMACAIAWALPQFANASCSTRLMTEKAGDVVASMTKDSGNHLWHGVGCYADEPGASKSCDWRTRIKTDERIGRDRRLVVLTSNHQTGSGAWDYVRVYGCSAGKIRLLYADRFLDGVTVEKSAPDRLVLRSGYWKAKDPVCCPTARERTTLRWDAKKGLYSKPAVTLLPLAGR